MATLGSTQVSVAAADAASAAADGVMATAAIARDAGLREAAALLEAAGRMARSAATLMGGPLPPHRRRRPRGRRAPAGPLAADAGSSTEASDTSMGMGKREEASKGVQHVGVMDAEGELPCPTDGVNACGTMSDVDHAAPPPKPSAGPNMSPLTGSSAGPFIDRGSDVSGLINHAGNDCDGKAAGNFADGHASEYKGNDAGAARAGPQSAQSNAGSSVCLSTFAGNGGPGNHPTDVDSPMNSPHSFVLDEFLELLTVEQRQWFVMRWQVRGGQQS